MNNFISLSSGIIVNLGTVAYVTVEPGPSLSKEPRSITLVFPAVTSRIENAFIPMELSFRGKEAEELLVALDQRGIDTTALRKAKNELQPGQSVIHLDVLAKPPKLAKTPQKKET
jgi:hypothetical protein